MNKPFKIQFLGAAGTVTGSRYLLTTLNHKILVDCGLFQGFKELRLKNWDQFPVLPADIDAIILTHAHLDHSGYIPKLIKDGFKGKIFCTKATYALCEILLADAGRIQEEDADWLNRKKFSTHTPALPLFSENEAMKSFEQFVTVNFDETFKLAEDMNVTLKYAGHILGAAIVIVEHHMIRIGFSGDLGRPKDSVFFPPEKMPEIDYLVVESTYGNRQHTQIDPIEEFEIVINEALKKNGVVLIPAFAVGRAQTLMFYLSILKKTGRIQNVPIFLNSPMAMDVTNIFYEFKSLHKLSDQQCKEMSENIQYVRTVDESKSLNNKKGPMIIIAASGMLTGGRILHHLKHFISEPSTTVVFAGFQSEGTRGRALQDGIKEIKIHQKLIPVYADIRVLKNSSAHADYIEILDWLTQSQIKPRRVFVIHGEIEASEKMKTHITEKFGWPCETPKQDQEYILD